MERKVRTERPPTTYQMMQEAMQEGDNAMKAWANLIRRVKSLPDGIHDLTLIKHDGRLLLVVDESKKAEYLGG